jgi:hypothetical protein
MKLYIIPLAIVLLAAGCSPAEPKSGKSGVDESADTTEATEPRADEKSTPIVFAPVSIPDNYEVLDSVSGDLDKDGIPELVVAYNTRKQKEDDYDDNVPRELFIYKLKQGQWTVWQKSEHALYGSRDGGMMGDPFEEIEVKNGLLLISQSGGSSWKWGHTDKYRFQDGGFRLIGYTGSYGKPCEYWQTVDFNLSTGKLIVEKEYESCEDESDMQEVYKRENETITKKVPKITLQNRGETEIKIVTPQYGHEIYI